ncbi:epidermal differentiation-specific protein-like [Lissotriton helveticus]
MSSIKLYSNVNFAGEPVTVTVDTPDLAALSKVAKSLIVVGDPWIAYAEKDFEGGYRLYKAGGDYSTLDDFANTISSLRQVKGGLGSPSIVLTDGVSYKGTPLFLTEATPKLSPHGMEKKAASLKVPKGAWQLFAEDDYKGANVAVLAGDHLDNLQSIGWFQKICSLEPYE